MQASDTGMLQGQPEGSLELVGDEAFILVKAAPRRSQARGEIVCCAGIDLHGKWVRLYPVSFRQLEDAQKFHRWDHIKYSWSKPKAIHDRREESRRVAPQSIEILSRLKEADRNPLVARCVVTSLDRELEAGRSLALLKPEILDFWAVRRSPEEFAKRERDLALLRAQGDMFAPTSGASLLPTRTCPYEFHYRYRDDDRVKEGTCQDWETEQTFFARLKDLASEQAAVDWVLRKFGEEYPRLGMALAMGTHSRRSEQWLINGIIRLKPEPQLSML